MEYRRSLRSPRRSLRRLLRDGESRGSDYRRCKQGNVPRRWVNVPQPQTNLADDGQLAAKQAELDEYKAVLALKETSSRSEFLAQIAETTPFESEGELENWVKRTEQEIRRKQRKDAGEEPEPEEEPTFPLVDRPDSELNDEEIKEKRRQRLMKAGWEARIKAREEKRKESERQEEIRRKEEEFRETDLTGWSAQLREEQDVSRQTSVDVMLTITVCHCTNARTQAKASAAGEPEIGGSAEPDEVDRHTSGRRQSQQEAEEEWRGQVGT
jgi:actin-related protein